MIDQVVISHNLHLYTNAFRFLKKSGRKGSMKRVKLKNRKNDEELLDY